MHSLTEGVEYCKDHTFFFKPPYLAWAKITEPGGSYHVATYECDTEEDGNSKLPELRALALRTKEGLK